MISFNNVNNFLDNFDFDDLQDVPLIDYDGNVHRYKVTTVLLNLPAGTHWTCVVVNGQTKECVQLESLIAGGVLPGKSIKRSWQWLLENKADIGAIILTKKNGDAVFQNEPAELVLTSLRNFKLTTADVRKCTHSTLMTMMEYRNIWHLFKDIVSTQHYYAVQQIKIEGKTFEAGDKLPHTFLELLQLARAEKISSLSYENRHKLFPSRVRDVMIKWCDEFEDRWHETDKFPTDRELKRFKKQMTVFWKEKKLKAGKQKIDVYLDEESDAEDVPAVVQNILAAKRLRIIETFDCGYEVIGTMKDEAETVKLNVSSKAMNKFASDGWFEMILATDSRTKLDFVQPNQTKVEIKTKTVKRIHILERLELITSPTELDKKKAVWFIPKVKNVEAAPGTLFRLSCDPRNLN